MRLLLCEYHANVNETNMYHRCRTLQHIAVVLLVYAWLTPLLQRRLDRAV